MKEEKFIVYRHISPSGKSYVGITRTNPKTRWHNGLGYRNNKHFYRAIQKYGWDNFRHQILYTDLTKDEASFAERVCIDVWGLNNPKKGYNINKGGIFGDRLSEETKKKLSDFNKGKVMSKETRDKISKAFKGEKHPMYGKHHTEEARRKMSIKKSGRNHPNYGKHLSNETKVKISQAQKSRKSVAMLDVENGNIIQIYSAISDACKDINGNPSNIVKCCKGNRPTAYGYKWKYVEEK